MSTNSQIESLARAITDNVKSVSEHLREKNLPFPSFDPDGPVSIHLQHTDAEISRQNAISQCMELLDLLQGPQMSVRPCYNAASLHAIYQFDIASKVPLTGSISFASLATQCGLHECDLRRILRFAMIYHRCFREPTPGFVAHTASSKQLAINAQVKHGVGLMFDDFWPSFAQTVKALQQFPDQAPNHTGWALAHQSTDKNLFEYLESEPARAYRFGEAMQFFTSTVPGNDPGLLLTNYPWESLGHATVVDVGGSTGYIARRLADAFPDLRLVVQDLASVVEKADSKAVNSRLVFQSQDFFQPNQEKNADVYLFRWILHDWPDREAQSILRALVPALKSGARIVVNDNVSPGQAGQMPHYAERFVREIDMIMLGAFNSYERERDDWVRLFRETDERFSAPKFRSIEQSLMGVIEVVWNG